MLITNLCSLALASKGRVSRWFNFNAKDDKKVERTHRCQQISRNYRDDSGGRIMVRVLILSRDHFEEMVIRIYVILLLCMPRKQKYHGKCGVRIELSGGCRTRVKKLAIV
jgi:hypothetical protein